MQTRNKSQHCCVLLGIFGQQCCVRLHWPKRLTGFKLYATSANIVVPCKRTQHVGLYNVACCWPTMLPPFAWALNNLIVYKPQKNVIRPVAVVFSLFACRYRPVFLIKLPCASYIIPNERKPKPGEYWCK